MAAEFPEFDGPVLASRGVELTIGGEADGPDGAVVALVDV
jgi:hypothetical protein